MMLRLSSILLLCAAVYAHNHEEHSLSYSQGVLIGDLSTLQYNVSGSLYALDEETLYIKDFYYDGRGPDAFFYIGTSGDRPSESGQLINYPQDDANAEAMVLKKMMGDDVTLHLPPGFKISQDLKWFSVWCRQYSVDFGNVIVPGGLQIPEKSAIVPDNSPVPNNYGVFLGDLSTLSYEVSGALYAVDEETLFIKDFTYNGKGPDAFFYIGTQDATPSHLGQIINYPQDGSNGEPKVLGAYNKQSVTLRLPQGFKISESLKWFSVWCRKFSVDFGNVIVPSNLEIPDAQQPVVVTIATVKPVMNTTLKPTTPKAPMPDKEDGVYIGDLSTLQYEVSGMVYAVDEETILIKDFHYNGEGPDAFFYIGTTTSSPDHTGQIIPYPQDVNTRSPKILSRIWDEDITLDLPHGFKISTDLKWLSVWCRQYSVDFGNVIVPRGLQIPEKKAYPEPKPESESEPEPESESEPEPESESEPESEPEPEHNDDDDHKHDHHHHEDHDEDDHDHCHSPPCSASDIVSHNNGLLYFTFTLVLARAIAVYFQ